MNLREEKQVAHKVKYAPNVVEALAAMDEAHQEYPDESLVAYGLIALIENEPTVVELMTTMDSRLSLPEDFPQELARLLAETDTIKLVVETATMDFARIMLVGQVEGDEKSQLLAFITEELEIKWMRDKYHTALTVILQHFFPHAEKDLDKVLSTLISVSELKEGRATEIIGTHNYYALAGVTWAVFTLHWQRAVEALAALKGKDGQNSVFMTHYHPQSVMGEHSVEQLLTLSSTDLRTLFNSDIAYIQARVPLDDGEKVSSTLSKENLRECEVALQVLERLLPTDSNNAHSIAEVVAVIKEYLSRLPNDMVLGTRYDVLFDALSPFSNRSIGYMKEKWTQTMSSLHMIADNVESNLGQGLHKFNFDFLALYHIANIRTEELIEQKKFNPDFLLILNELQIFHLLSAVLWCWYEVSYELEECDKDAIEIHELINLPFTADVEHVKRVLEPVISLLMTHKPRHFLALCSRFGVDLEKVQNILSV